ncbi:MAG TPA: ABC transporter substrate-binding protein [Acidimicrobiales bacterium]|nr:ABC transporter substrate-binding protein [Acidimicrobiales bacterium]
MGRPAARAGAVGLAAAAMVGLLAGTSRASTTTTDNARTLTVALPGPFNGCSVLDPAATPTTGAVLDLLRPSAFATDVNGQPVGAGGPIASAELTSLSPETVVYTIAPHELWSDGLTFNGSDLVAWWQWARSLPSVLSDGYRDIQSLTVGSNGLTVTAIFATPDASWNLLFRDVEARGVTRGCAIANLVARPSLGPYRVVSATKSRIVLAMNRAWTGDPARFGHVVLVDSGALPRTASTYFASYLTSVGRAQVEALSAHQWVASHLGTTSDIEVMAFSPLRRFTDTLAMRRALSWAIERQSLINSLWGSITFAPAVAASAVYSQGENAYPGGGGTTPTTPTTVTGSTTLTQNGLADCRACALQGLADAGWRRTASGWVDGAKTKLRLIVVTGPSATDRATATAVARQWASIGVAASVTHASSDVLAAATAAEGHADVAIYDKPTGDAASVSARSWSGAAYSDSYPSGFRSATVTSLYAAAQSNFNAAAATATWLSLDQAVLTSYWVRPLYTAPSLVEWNNSLVGVTGAISERAFVDELTGWNSSVVAGG